MGNTTPVPVVPLDYDDRGAASPWEAVVRLVALAVLAQGVTAALPTLWDVALTLLVERFQSAFRAGNPQAILFLLASAVRLVAGVLLIVSWGLVHVRRRGGWRCAVIGEWMLIVQSLGQPALSILQYVQMNMAGAQLVHAAINTMLWSSASLVMPAFVLVLFGRREVSALLTAR